jgi:CDP-glycerol glycerophosphotransferase
MPDAAQPENPGPRPEGQPLVSVVVPIYNVERYLRECLESLAHQTMSDLEVVMVDDGSTDTSAAVAADFAALDDRFRLVRQPNGGLGHARNTGARHATGRYIAFVDSDDIVTPRAYELLTSTLEETGSDFASGNFHRLTTTGTRQAGMVFTAFNAYRPRTHVRRHPALLNDRTAWNKLFRRSFWDEHRFAWPEGVLYEDIPVTLRAHVLAKAVDVVREPVYLWRARSGDSASITQRRVEPRAIGDRYTAVDGISRFMAEQGETDLKARYDRSVAEQDLRYFLQHLDEGDAGFHARFLELANDFFDRAADDVFDDLPAVQRLEWHLVRRRMLPELLEVVRFENSGDMSLTPFVRRGRRFFGDYPFRGDPAVGVPDDVYRLSKEEIPMPARIEDVWWDGEVLHLSGFAYIAFLPLESQRSGRIRLTLEESGHRDRVVPLELERVHRPDLTAAAPDGSNHDWAGWHASVPVGRLKQGGRWRTGTWRLRVEVRTSGVTRRRWVSGTTPGRAQRPAPQTVGPARIVTTTPAGHFSLQVATQYAEVDHATLDGDVLELGGTLVGRTLDPQTSSFELARADGTATVSVPVTADVGDDDRGHRFLTRIDLTRLPATDDPMVRTAEDVGAGSVWALSLQADAGARVAVLAAASLDELRLPRGTAEVVLRADRTAALTVVDRTVRAEVETVTWQDGRLLVTATYPADQAAPELVLRHRDVDVEVVLPVERAGDRVTADVDITAVPTGAGPVLLSDGHWRAFLRPVGSVGAGVRVLVARDALDRLPLRVTADRLGLTVRDAEERMLALEVLDHPEPADRTRVGRRRLEEQHYLPATAEPLLDQVLVDGYVDGRESDDVRAVLAELRERRPGLEVVWTLGTLTPAPEGVRTVARHGAEWYAALGRSRYVVLTDLLGIGHLARRAGQTTVQLWHGLPAHPVGLADEHLVSSLGRIGLDRMRAETARWDHLVSGGPAHSDALRAGFGTTVTVTEAGLPRHDLLVDPARADERRARAAAARELLGAGDRTLVVWAAARRPRQEVLPGRHRLDLGADPSAVAAALGDDTVLVVRPHPRVADRPIGDARVVDGGWLPDVVDLLLAADVVVTDRSSVLLDAALAGRPVVRYEPDQPAGADQATSAETGHLTPGEVPARVAGDEEQLVKAVHEAAQAPSPVEPPAELLDRWVPRRDGRAAARVVDLLLGERTAVPDETLSPDTVEDQ